MFCNPSILNLPNPKPHFPGAVLKTEDAELDRQQRKMKMDQVGFLLDSVIAGLHLGRFMSLELGGSRYMSDLE